jgi:Xaa-Pro dipeptidase
LTINYDSYVGLHGHWLSLASYPLEHDFPIEEYLTRIGRARALMAEAKLDGLVITSGEIGQWFTSQLSPNEWHDRCQSRSAWYILTATSDVLLMTPTTAGEHMNTARRSTWVTEILPIVERTTWPRVELWDLDQIVQIFARLRIDTARLGFELGDCMTLGLAVHDFLRLRDLLPKADLVDGSSIVRRLMSVHTALEIQRIRKACQAGVWVYEQVPGLLTPGMTERELAQALEETFYSHHGPEYAFSGAGGWDVRNRESRTSNLYHGGLTDRKFQIGDYVARGFSGVHFRGYPGDIDRGWALGMFLPEVERYYQITWECNQAMAETIRAGVRCSEIYAAGAAVEARHRLPTRLAGRTGHGIRNTGALSVHPDNHTVLEPGMVISVEPMFGTEFGWFDLEDQYLVTETGREILHKPAPEKLPVIET